MDTITTVPGVLLVEEHEEGRHDEEEDIRDGVDELRDVGGEGVVLLTPVYGAGASLQMTPHADSTVFSQLAHICKVKVLWKILKVPLE